MAAIRTPGQDAARHDRAHEAVALMQQFSLELSAVVYRSLGHAGTANLDFALLATIHLAPGISPSELPARVGRPRSTVARGLGRLVDSGLVERRPGGLDRRRVELVLTRRGRRGLERLEVALQRHLEGSEATVKEILHLLGRQAVRTGRPEGWTALGAIAGAGRAAEASAPAVREVAQRHGLDEAMDRYALVAIAVEPTRPSHLAHQLSLTPSGVSSLVDRLSARGFVERLTHAVSEDGRAVLVRATPRGREAAEAIVEAYRPYLAGLADALAATLVAD